jgi:hypothetical protein
VRYLTIPLVVNSFAAYLLLGLSKGLMLGLENNNAFPASCSSFPLMRACLIAPSPAFPLAVAPAPSPAAADQRQEANAGAVVAGSDLQQAADPAPSGSLATASAARQLKFKRTHDVSPADLAAQHPEEMQRMRQLAAAELAKLATQAAGGRTSMQQLPQQPSEQPQQAQSGRQQVQPGSVQGPEQQQSSGKPHSVRGWRPWRRHAAPASPPLPVAAAASTAPQLLPPPLDDAELMRYAIMYGLLTAHSAAERQAALTAGAAAAARTAAWYDSGPFVSEAELRRFEHLASWQVRSRTQRQSAVKRAQEHCGCVVPRETGSASCLRPLKACCTAATSGLSFPSGRVL